MSSKRITDYEVQFVTRWRKAGYSAYAISLALGCGVKWVRSIGYGLPGFEGQFGRKELPVRWTRALGTRLYIAPNLLPVYGRFKVFMASEPSIDVKGLKMAMAWVSDERLELWRADWLDKYKFKGKCQMLDAKIYQEQMGQVAAQPVGETRA